MKGPVAAMERLLLAVQTTGQEDQDCQPKRAQTGSLNLLMSILLHSCSSPHAVLVALCASRYTCCRYECKQGRRENVDWIFSDVGVLYMNKWNGLDNNALKGLSSLHYKVKGN